MQFVRREVAILVCCVASAVMAACGGTGSPSMSSPLAPSSGGGPTISGQVTGPAAASRALRVIDPTVIHTMDSRGITVSIVGTSVSTTTDGSGQFTLTNAPTGTVQLNFSAPGSNATVTISGVGPDDQVQVVVSLSGNSAHVESEHHSAPDNKREYQGRITAVDLAGRTIQVSGLTIEVPVSAIIRHGSKTVPFEDLKIGDHVEVRGVRDGTTVTATEVKVESDDGEDDDHEGDDEPQDGEHIQVTELKGAISGLSGGCPSTSFFVEGTKVATTGATNYEHGTCTTLKNDVQVEIKGTAGTDGVVSATRVAFDD